MFQNNFFPMTYRMKGASAMTKRPPAGRGYRIFIAILVVLLIGCIALFVYGTMHNGIPQPQLPGEGLFARAGGAHG